MCSPLPNPITTPASHFSLFPQWLPQWLNQQPAHALINAKLGRGHNICLNKDDSDIWDVYCHKIMPGNELVDCDEQFEKQEPSYIPLRCDKWAMCIVRLSYVHPDTLQDPYER